MKYSVTKQVIIGIFVITLSACSPSVNEAPSVETNEVLFYPPIVVVNISRSSTIEIQSTALNQDLTYSSIPIDKDTVLRGQPAVDSENNLYIPYGSQDNYLAKLGPDGSVMTIEIDTEWHYNSQWVGDKFLIIPHSPNEMYLIDLDLTIETIPIPSLILMMNTNLDTWDSPMPHPEKRFGVFQRL